VTIPLSDGAPVRIVDADWSVVRRVDRLSDRQAQMFVRRHADGRRIAYGSTSGVPNRQVGYLLPARTDKSTAELDLLALLPVAHELDLVHLVQAELAKLPPIALD